MTANDEHLGPVGGRIVAEVIRLLTGDSESFLSQEPDWTPSYGTNDDFRMVDLLRAASVVATV